VRKSRAKNVSEIDPRNKCPNNYHTNLAVTVFARIFGKTNFLSLKTSIFITKAFLILENCFISDAVSHTSFCFVDEGFLLAFVDGCY